jgi:hypothetical protein
LHLIYFYNAMIVFFRDVICFFIAISTIAMYSYWENKLLLA